MSIVGNTATGMEGYKHPTYKNTYLSMHQTNTSVSIFYLDFEFNVLIFNLDFNFINFFYFIFVLK